MIKFLINKLIKIVSICFPYRLYVRLQILKQIFVSKWISHEFRKVGKSFFCGKNLKTKGTKYIIIGSDCCLGSYSTITAWENDKFIPIIQIGNSCNFGDFLHLTCINKIIIGNDVLVGKFVTITDNSHGLLLNSTKNIPPIKRQLVSKGSIIIEDNVWIGDKVTVLPGVKIGRGAIIGANTVVSHDIPAYSIAVGSSARVIKNI